MFFSVIIPLYNKAEYIESALRSVLDQRHQAFEVIVVDDGSTDDGARRVAAIGDSRLRLLHQRNSGVSVARNRGVREATGDHIAFLDADDFWTPTYLSAISKMVVQFPDCGLYATHFYRFNDSGSMQVPKLWRIRAGTAPQRIKRCFFEMWSHAILFYTSSVVIQARILRESGISFPEGEQLAEDHDVWFRIAERWPLAYFPEPLVGCRVGVSDSLSTKLCSVEILPLTHRLISRYRSQTLPSSERRGVARIIGIHRINAARNLLLKGERRRAIEHLRDPFCLRAPRYWLRVLSAACFPASLRARLLKYPE